MSRLPSILLLIWKGSVFAQGNALDWANVLCDRSSVQPSLRLLLGYISKHGGVEIQRIVTLSNYWNHLRNHPPIECIMCCDDDMGGEASLFLHIDDESHLRLSRHARFQDIVFLDGPGNPVPCSSTRSYSVYDQSPFSRPANIH